jgi:hypothetical protein
MRFHFVGENTCELIMLPFMHQVETIYTHIYHASDREFDQTLQ